MEPETNQQAPSPEATADPLSDDEQLAELVTTGGRKLPFPFAAQNGVLLEYPEDQPPLLCHLADLQLEVLVEVRRFLGCSFQTQVLDKDSFQRHLTLAYQKSDNEALKVADDMGSDMDLSRLAEEIPEAGDLMFWAQFPE